MPIFKRFKIDRYKEVMINQSAGLVQDGGFSTYTFDNENNRDFVGIVKDIRLIGDVVEITMDTGRFTVNQINNTTQTEFDQLVSNGTIRVTERSLGWVEIAKTRASFYYEDCLPTSVLVKRPVSEHYYDFSTFTFGTSLVAGSGLQDTTSEYSIGETALRPIGTFDPNIGNNMGVFGPGFNQMDLQSYMRTVINSTISQGQGLIQNQQGESRPVNGWSPLDGEILSQIPLYLANTNEHFDNPNSQTISSGKYGRNRDTISEGFRASSYVGVNLSKSIGQCLETMIQTTTTTTTDVTPTTGGEFPTTGGDFPYTPTPEDLESFKSLVENLTRTNTTFKYKDKATEKTQGNEITSIIIQPDQNLYPESLQATQFFFYELMSENDQLDSLFEEIERQYLISKKISKDDIAGDINLSPKTGLG
jgi:hypothetical protein